MDMGLNKLWEMVRIGKPGVLQFMGQTRKEYDIPEGLNNNKGWGRANGNYSKGRRRERKIEELWKRSWSLLLQGSQAGG